MSHRIKFKKTAALSLAAVLSFGIVACGNDGEDSAAGSSESSESFAKEMLEASHLYKYDNEGAGWKHNEGSDSSPYSNNPTYIEDYANLDIYKDSSELLGQEPTIQEMMMDDFMIPVEEGKKFGPHKAVRAVDNNTVAIEVNGKVENVRLLGIEGVELDGNPDFTKDKVQELLENNNNPSGMHEDVYLIPDPESPDKDEDGNLLRYVFFWEDPHIDLSKTNNFTDSLAQNYMTFGVQNILLTQGQARFYMEPDQKPLKYAEALYRAEEEGAQYHKSIWNKERKEALANWGK